MKGKMFYRSVLKTYIGVSRLRFEYITFYIQAPIHIHEHDLYNCTSVAALYQWHMFEIGNIKIHVIFFK